MTLPFEALRTGTLPLRAGTETAIPLAPGGHWFGHGFSHDQPFPLETGSIANDAFAVNNIQCPIWMCTAGIALLLETTAPIAVAVNRDGDGLLRLAPSEDAPLRVFAADTLAAARTALLAHLRADARPPVRPDLYGDCFFCTWTQFPRCITQDRVLAMGREIRDRGYPCSTIVIDDRWENNFGELEFSPDFPDPAGMFAELHRLGFQALLWTTPFVNREAATFPGLERDGVLVPRRDGAGAAMLRWWGGEAGLVDVTNPVGRDWFRQRLLHLRRLGADGFKIDGGDAKYQPSPDIAAFHDPQGASGFSDALLALYEEIAPGLCETRTAWLSQQRAILWRLGGKDSHWGRDNGLKAMLNLALHLALAGYDSILPDMVPGRVQTMDASDPLPTDELMVRWTELSAFLPLLQFSYYPWNYAAPVADAVLALARLHKALQDYLARHAADVCGAPLLRPMGWGAAAGSERWAVADQYFLGDDLLVCPVLDPGLDARPVAIPGDGWLDAWTGTPAAPGPHDAWPAPCPGIPVFVRAVNASLAATLREALSRLSRGTVPTGVTTATWQAGIHRDLSVTG
ncbi:MAG: glycoside hydrolase family 31 protein [Kiritimatiellia bacterium]|jgi:alpha-glucosidase (family GH31 glycosyl hydrolase)